MSHGDDALSLSAATEKVLAILGDDGPDAGADDGAGMELESGATPAASRESPESEDSSDDTAAADEADMLIDPPASWKADAKRRFHDLPRDLQKVIADRERERETHFSKTQQETAEAR